MQTLSLRGFSFSGEAFALFCWAHRCRVTQLTLFCQYPFSPFPEYSPFPGFAYTHTILIFLALFFHPEDACAVDCAAACQPV